MSSKALGIQSCLLSSIKASLGFGKHLMARLLFSWLSKKGWSVWRKWKLQPHGGFLCRNCGCGTWGCEELLNNGFLQQQKVKCSENASSLQTLFLCLKYKSILKCFDYFLTMLTAGNIIAVFSFNIETAPWVGQIWKGFWGYYILLGIKSLHLTCKHAFFCPVYLIPQFMTWDFTWDLWREISEC